MAISISDRTDIRQNYQKQKETLHYNRLNPPRKYKQQSCTYKLDNLRKRTNSSKSTNMKYEIENTIKYLFPQLLRN